MTGDSYHHGDLRAACLRAARELLEEDGSAALSLRAVARRAGVSPSAPYRHYADRDALLAAVAASGYQELAERLVAAQPAPPSSPEDLVDGAVAYVRFALEHPALFRVMFVEPCDAKSEERTAAVAAISGLLAANVRQVFPEADPEAMSTAAWALVHGLAFLYLDSKLDSTTPEVLAGNVRAVILALFTAHVSAR